MIEHHDQNQCPFSEVERGNALGLGRTGSRFDVKPLYGAAIRLKFDLGMHFCQLRLRDFVTIQFQASTNSRCSSSSERRRWISVVKFRLPLRWPFTIASTPFRSR